MFVDDTIAAIASAPGGAMRGILRISGPGTLDCVRRIFHASVTKDWQRATNARRFSGNLWLPPPAGQVPCELYFWPTQRSYTRQPAAELHTVGSPPILHTALRTFCTNGARLAEPGEFTLRAFLAGRIDLAQAEAVLGVIDARGQSELDVALTQLAGGLSAPLDQLRSRLLNLRAELEAGLDFVDEDIEFVSRDEVSRQLDEAAATVRDLTDRMNQRVEFDATQRVVLRGWPNVGKSSLWNALIGKPRAIVTDRAGTTRDYLTSRLELDGISCILVDTAGIELESTGLVGSAAQEAAEKQTQQCDLLVLCLDGTRELNPWEHAELMRTGDRPRIIVLTKSDRPARMTGIDSAIPTSARTGTGLSELREVLHSRLVSCQQDQADVIGSTATRCRASLQQAAESLARASHLAQQSLGDELIAEELRWALDELGKVVGAVYTDDVLDRIFSRFCIGK